MARKKVNLAWIANDSARRATFKKRKNGLMKKVSELSTLCGVGACAVVYGHQEAIPDVWPDAEGAARVLSVFRSMPEMEQSKKKMDQEGFLRQRIMKLGEQIKKQERENMELASRVLMNETLAGRMSVDCLGAEDVAGLGWMVEMKLKAVQERICNVRATMVIEGSQTRNVVGEKRVETMGGGGAAVSPVGRPEWFLDTVNQTMNASNDHLYWGGEEDVVQPLVDNSNLWLPPPYDDLFTGN